MSIGNGFNRFLGYKAQTAFGTKAAGLAKSLVPLRTGEIFQVQPYRKARGTVVQAIPKVSNLYNIAKFVKWGATLELVNPRTAHDTVRDFLRCAFGRETITTVGPFTKKYHVYDPLIDGGTDSATVFYGRALTLQEQSDDAAGVAIFSHAIQDAVVDQLQVVFEPDEVTRLVLSGMGSDFQDDQAEVTPADPTGGVHTWAEIRNTANSGLRIGTANPPVAADNVSYNRATLTLANKIRYVPWLGQTATFQARIPVRNDSPELYLDITMDVENAIASQWDAKDATDAWVAGTAVNVDFLSYISSTEIFEIFASAATAAAIVEDVRFSTPGPGPQVFTTRIRIYPAALLTDAMIQITTVDV